MIDVRAVIFNRDRAARTDLLAAVSNTAAAVRTDGITADRALIAGDIQNLNDIGILLIPTHCAMYPLAENGAFFVNTAAHSGFGTVRHNRHRYIAIGILQVSV